MSAPRPSVRDLTRSVRSSGDVRSTDSVSSDPNSTAIARRASGAPIVITRRAPAIFATEVASKPSGPERDDAADHFMTQDHGQLNILRERPLPEMDVCPADRTELDPCQDCAGFELLRDRHFLDSDGRAEAQ